MVKVADLDTFERVYKLLAYQNAGIFNMSSTASNLVPGKNINEQ